MRTHKPGGDVRGLRLDSPGLPLFRLFPDFGITYYYARAVVKQSFAVTVIGRTVVHRYVRGSVLYHPVYELLAGTESNFSRHDDNEESLWVLKMVALNQPRALLAVGSKLQFRSVITCTC